MTLFHHPGHLSRAIFAVLGLALSSVYAQTNPTPAAASARAPAVAPAYTSVFDNYQPYTEDKTANWRQANDNTANIGGWRAYAKEAAGPDSAPASTPAASTVKP